MVWACSRRLTCRWEPGRGGLIGGGTVPIIVRGRCDLRPGGRKAASALARCRVLGDQASQVARAAYGCQAATPAAPFPDEAARPQPGRMDDDRGLRHRSGQERPGPPHAALPGLRPGPQALGAVREPTVRELGGVLVTVIPDRARCTGCDVTPRRARRQAAAAPRLRRRPDRPGPGRRRPGSRAPAHRARPRRPGRHRARLDPPGPPQTGRLRTAGVQAVVALDPDALPARVLPGELACALDALGAAAMTLGGRFAVPHASPWARVTVLTRGQLLNLAPDG